MDGRVPLRAKLAVALLVGYLAFPLDVVPDFIPGIGQLDDALVLAGVLAWLVRGAGRDVVTELWPGSERSLEALLRVGAK